jgi:hypothetical protein
MDEPPVFDAYKSCETACSHDLARGVLVADLLREDGIYEASFLDVRPVVPSVLAALLARGQSGIVGPVGAG